jgi:hypothetical protein
LDIPIELIILLLFFLLPAISRLFEKKRPEQAPPPESHYPEPIEGRDPRVRDRAGAAEPESLEEALRQIREALGQPSPQAERRPEPPPRARPSEPVRPGPQSMRRPDAEHVRPGPDAMRPGPEPMRRSEPEHVQPRGAEHLQHHGPERARPVPEPMRARTQPVLPAREQRVRGKTRFEKDPVLSKPLEVEVLTTVPSQHAWLLEALRTPQDAAKAMKLHEVLDPPPSVGWRRRRRR